MVFSFNKQKNKFYSGENEYIPKIKIYPDYKYSEYEIYFFYNDFTSENDIYQIFCESQRIGYIFPIEAIESKEHDKADDEYFLKYAFVAINLLLNKLKSEQIGETINLSECFPNTQLLIICKENLNNKNLELGDYILSLNEYGYTKRMDVYFPKQLTPLVQKEKSIKLSKIQKDIDSITYVKEEFYDLLPLKTDNPLVIFHRLYQFIEILIMELFNFQFKKFISQLKSEREDLFQKKEELDNLTNEKKRISIILNNCSGIDTTLRSNLNDACMKILEIYNQKSSSDYAANLYKVRCCLFHSLYKFKKENEKYLFLINENLFLILLSIFSSISFENIYQD